MFFDTDVSIWALRGHPTAEETIDQAPHILISAITYMELLQGARNRQEIIMIDQTIAILDIDIVHVDEPISQRGFPWSNPSGIATHCSWLMP